MTSGTAPVLMNIFRSARKQYTKRGVARGLFGVNLSWEISRWALTCHRCHQLREGDPHTHTQ